MQKEIKEDEKDYLFILKSLNEIPFPLGKNLLVNFLKGNYQNESIQKNKLNKLHNFASLVHLSESRILELLEELIYEGYVSCSSSMFNKFIKVLGITFKGKQELMSPSFNKRKAQIINHENSITEEDKKIFDELPEYFSKYNNEQKKAIISNKEKILCMAGAGSGKTTVLTERIHFLQKYRNISQDEILAITFTRKAKEEMQRRLRNLGINANVETFNSFCEKILIKKSYEIYGKKVRLAGYQEKILALLNALSNLSLKLEDVINEYFSNPQRKSKTKIQLQNILMNDCFEILDYFKIKKKENFKDFTTNIPFKNLEMAKKIFNIVKEIEQYMEIQNLRTYSDQINDVNKFFNSNPEKITKFKHILIDEFQDINDSQAELIKLLNSPNIFCVGDPRQSIFGWRGSDIKYILNFEKEYPDSEIIYLKKNYRSNNHIVKFMNKSIKQMKLPELESNHEKEKEIKLYKFQKDEEEHEFISRKILTVNIPREEIFVIARTNNQLKKLSKTFEKNGIKYILKTDETKDRDTSQNHVTLSTIHSIKGLEAEMVFVMGCNAMNFPNRASEHPIMEIVKMYEYNREEEERRLFYVAISRAKNILYLTHSKKITHFINDEMNEIVDKVEF